MENKNSGFRYKAGMGFIILGIISPLVGLLVPMLGLDSTTTSLLVGFFMVGGPEVFLILGAALAGKQAVDMIKNKIKGVFAIPFFMNPAPKGRYNFGLALLLLSILGNWVFAYLDLTLDLGLTLNQQLLFVVIADAIAIIALLILGPEFWSKIKSLFTWEDKIV